MSRESPEALRKRAQALRESAAQSEASAAYADGQAYYQELDHARKCRDAASRLDEEARQIEAGASA